jgi:hypothetical protein
MSKQTNFTIRISLTKSVPIELTQEEIKERFYELFEADLDYKVDGIDVIKYEIVDRKTLTED